MINRDLFNKCIYRLEESLSKGTYSPKYTEAQKDIFYNVLNFGEYTDFDVQYMIMKYIENNENTYLPMLGELTKHKPTLEDDVRFAKIKQIIFDSISNSSLKLVLEDPLAHMVVDRIGGIQKLGMLSEQRAFDFIEFNVKKELYNSCKQEMKFKEPPLYIGNTNSKIIRFVGDKEKCLAWHENVENNSNTLPDFIKNKLIEVN